MHKVKPKQFRRPSSFSYTPRYTVTNYPAITEKSDYAFILGQNTLTEALKGKNKDFNLLSPAADYLLHSKNHRAVLCSMYVQLPQLRREARGRFSHIREPT